RRLSARVRWAGLSPGSSASLLNPVLACVRWSVSEHDRRPGLRSERGRDRFHISTHHAEVAIRAAAWLAERAGVQRVDLHLRPDLLGDHPRELVADGSLDEDRRDALLLNGLHEPRKVACVRLGERA